MTNGRRILAADSSAGIREKGSENTVLLQTLLSRRVGQLVTSHSSLFLNNALLEAGHAIRYDGGAKEE